MEIRDDDDDRAKHLCLILLRHERRLSQGDFARLVGIGASQYSEYDRGESPIPDRLLEQAAAASGFPPFLLDSALRQLRAFRAAARGWSSARSVLVGGIFAELLEISGAMVETILGSPGGQPAGRRIASPSAEDRAAVPQLWACLEKLTPEQRLAVAEELEEYQSWALCERVAAASLEEAASRPAEALQLALLAQRIAELAGGAEPWRRRLQGYAGVHVSNAHRVLDDLPAAEAVFTPARKLWEAGAPGDPGLLSEAIVLGIEATLRAGFSLQP